MSRPAGYAFVIGAALFWSSLGLLGRLAMDLGVDTLSLLVWRTVFALCFLVPALLLVRRRSLAIPARSIPLWIAMGFCQALDYIAFFQSIALIPIGVAISIFYVYPVLAALLAWAVLRERFSVRKVGALVVAVCGCVLVAGLGGQGGLVSPAGVSWALLAALGNAGYALLVKVAVRNRPPEQVLAYSLVFALLFLFLAIPFGHGALLEAHPAAAWGALALLALGPTLLGYGFFALALQRIDLGTASIVSTLEPALASVLAFAVLGERLVPLQILGLGLVVVGAALTLSQNVEPTRPDRLR